MLDVSKNNSLWGVCGQDQNFVVTMTLKAGIWEAPIALSNLQDLVGGLTYADGKLRSTNRDIAETPFSTSINERFKLSGKIILQYDQDSSIHAFEANEERRARELTNLVNLILPKYKEEFESFYFLLERNFSIDDIMFSYDALMQSLRDEGERGRADLQQLEISREGYQALLQTFDRERTFEKRRYFLNK
jgi:hypothetical protein